MPPTSCALAAIRLRKNDFHSVPESVGNEISTIYSQHLFDGRIVIYDAEDNCVDVRERLIDVLRKNISCPSVDPSTH